MNNYYKHLWITGKRLGLILVLFTLSRLVFYLFNLGFFRPLSFQQVILHFFYGLRFDIAVVFLFNLLFVLLSVLPSVLLVKKWYQATLKILFISINSLLLAANFVDTKFYEFEGKRLTADIFSKEWLGDDFVTLLPEFVKDFWYMFIGFAAFIWLFVKLYPSFNSSRERDTSLKYVKQIIVALVLMVASVFAGRGGVQLKPIGIIVAARYTSPQFMPLILNSPFTIVKTFGDNSLPASNYFNINEVDSVFNPVKEFKSNDRFKNKNVVIIILESFGREYSGYLNDTLGYTPNLDAIMRKGLTFKNAFANGKRSIEALPSIFSSLPALMDNALVNTQYASNAIEGIAELLGKKGYETAFFHGGKNGTMGFDNFVKLVGVKKYFGLDEYSDEANYDGGWGVYDEPYLQYFNEELGKLKEPFFASVFTLSSHHPYKIPKKHENKFPKGDLVNLESIGYADYALGEFFKKAEQQPWYNNTLFVLTADHTAQSKQAYYKSNEGMYAVPIVFFEPGNDNLKGLSDKVCQQADILPSVMHYLNNNEPFVSFGSSVFSDDSLGFAVSYLTGVYQLITNNGVLSFDGSVTLDFNCSLPDTVNFTDSVFGRQVMMNQMENKLKGIIQQYNFRMHHNLMQYTGKLSEYKNN